MKKRKEKDDVSHIHSVGGLDLYYKFNTPEAVNPQSVTITGYVNSDGDVVEVTAYNWASGGWEKIGEIEGKGNPDDATHTYENLTFDLTEDHLNEDVDISIPAENVAIRFSSIGGSGASQLAIDEIKVNYPRHITFPEDYWIVFFSHRLIQYTPSRTDELSRPLRGFLRGLQCQDGHEAGSWNPSATLGGQGRVFSTSMALTILNELEHGLRMQP